MISDREFGTKSHSRNPLVFGLFERIDMVEQIGSGIGRIKDAIKQSGLPEPVFKTAGMFSVVFQRPDISKEKTRDKTRDKTRENNSLLRERLGERLGKKLGERLGETSWKILELMYNDENITIKRISEALNISTTAVEKNIKQLKKKGLLMHEGSARKGRWVIID